MQTGKKESSDASNAKPEAASFIFQTPNEVIKVNIEDLQEFAEEMCEYTGNLTNFKKDLDLIMEKYLRNYGNSMGNAKDRSKEYKVLDLLTHFFDKAISQV